MFPNIVNDKLMVSNLPVVVIECAQPHAISIRPQGVAMGARHSHQSVYVALANVEVGSICLQIKTSKLKLVLSASRCFQFALSANGSLHFHVAENFEISKRALFCCPCGNRLLPIAANGWVKSQYDLSLEAFLCRNATQFLAGSSLESA